MHYRRVLKPILNPKIFCQNFVQGMTSNIDFKILRDVIWNSLNVYGRVMAGNLYGNHFN